MVTSARLLLGVLLVVGGYAAGTADADVGESLSLIPKPSVVEPGTGYFVLSDITAILRTDRTTGSRSVEEYLAGTLAKYVGKRPPSADPAATDGTIELVLDENMAGGTDQGYELIIKPERITLRGRTPAGLFYGVQTLRQLLPPTPPQKPEPVKVPCLRIQDAPRFAWRGLMLDCSRTFLTMDYLKRYVDLLALYKMNVLHLHLTDDQGWRMEIKAHPELTEVGGRFASRYDKERNGFYTQREMRELVAYAAARHVTLVPEIEMPGHCMGALTAYPELSCTGGPFEVRPFNDTTGIQYDVFCPGNEETFKVLEDALTEVIDLFPSRYIHIGGDEVPKTNWKKCPKCQARIKQEGLANEEELQSYFVKRMERFLVGKGRQLLGWDEIMEGGLAPEATVMSWRGVKPGIEALKQGHKVVFSPTTYCYLDYASTLESLRTTYLYEPIPDDMPADCVPKVLGVQGNMWTHIARDDDAIDRQIFPRLIALAEVGWSAKDARALDDFSRRLSDHLPRLDAMKVKYSEQAFVQGKEVGVWSPDRVTEEYKVLEWDITPQIGGTGKYYAFFQYTKGACRLGIEWAALLVDGKEVSRDTHRGTSGTVKEDNGYALPLAEAPPGAKYTLRASVRSEGGGDSSGVVSIGKAK